MKSDYENTVIEERYMRPSAKYPLGSYLHMVSGEVTIATGHYATLYPGKPSLNWHGGPPFVVMDGQEKTEFFTTHPQDSDVR